LNGCVKIDTKLIRRLYQHTQYRTCNGQQISIQNKTKPET
jgi:hypothetical protein